MGHGNNATSHEQLIDNLKRNNLVRTKSVEDAMRRLDRAVFCPLSTRPYEDAPQNLGWNATITSPYMVYASPSLEYI
jgi:protein-L-isoaspartate(D-aspartate) O-methyltransferase